MKYPARIIGTVRVMALVCAALVGASGAFATTISGVVHNGTTGKVAPGVDIILLNLQNGMDSVATTKTDAQGHFELNYTPSGQTSLLVRASYKGVNFHKMLPPGQVTADVQIYEPATDAKTVQVPTRIIYFQPDGTNLLIGEEYDVQNKSTPPVAFFKTTGNFEFQIPDSANLEQVNAAGPEGMSVVQGTMDRGGKKYAIAFAFRPGESRVRLSYTLPYASNLASFHVSAATLADSVMLLAPPTVTVASAGFQPGGTTQGLSVYLHEGPISAAGFDVSISGTAPPPPDNAGQAGQDGGSTRDRDSGQSVSAVPPRLDTLKWVLIGGFASIFLLGAGYLYRKPVAIAAGGASAQAAPSARARGNAGAHAPKSGSQQTAAPANDALGEIDRKVGASLDELKDILFKLELRRQAGTISEQDYTQQRARAEKILRDLVRG
jgi:hypothetical protein